MLIYKLVEISMFGYFFYVSTYNFILSVAGSFSIKKKESENIKINKIGVLIPAFKEDNVIIHTASSALKQYYPREFFEVILIADSLQSETLTALKLLPIKIIEVSFSQSTKVKSLKAALNYSENDFDFLVILDADNLMDENFLVEANSSYNSGEKIVQGRRLAKNRDNAMAILDDLSEQINNHINRKGSCNLQGSASIAGSGFLIDQKVAFDIINSLNSVGGFDKDLELQSLSKNIKTSYNDSMIIYDEKVASSNNFKNQRKRWISSQYSSLKTYFIKGINELIFKFNICYFNSAILRNLQLPRIVNLGIFSCICILIFVIHPVLMIPFSYWILIYALFLFSLLISIPRSHFNKRTLISMLKLPGVFLTMFFLLFQLKGANKKFIHTPHTKNELFENE